MSSTNKMEIRFTNLPQNESFARVVISAFAAQLDPTIEELQDIKTAVSEAVTNAIIHGYEGMADRFVRMSAELSQGGELYVEIGDEGIGIEDLARAREPFYTSKPEMERSGMGFTVMESFMDEIAVDSAKDKGTTVKMWKRISKKQT